MTDRRLPPPMPGFGPAEPILEQFNMTPFARMAQAGAQHAAGTIANDLQPALDVANDPRNAWIGTNPVGRGAIEGLAALKAVLGIFAGPKAATANLAKLAEAQALQQAGSRGEDIWKQTGWFQAPDAGWRFEIPDGWANLSSNIPKNQFDPNMLSISMFQGKDQELRTLGNTLNHEALYQAYPQLKDIPVGSTGFNFGIAGAYDPTKNKMYLAGGKPDSVRNTVLHETQHTIQGIEGTAPGGNVGEWLPANHHEMSKEVSERLSRIEKEVQATNMGFNPYTARFALTKQTQGKRLYPHEEQTLAALDAHPYAADWRALVAKDDELRQQQQAAYDSYNRLSGEVESRLVEKRSNNLGLPEQQTYPPSEYDVAPARHIIKERRK